MPRHPGQRSSAATALASLQTLYCFPTQVSDLGPLAALASLKKLDCSPVWVSDLGPLAGLTFLELFYCYSPSVSDLGRWSRCLAQGAPLH